MSGNAHNRLFQPQFANLYPLNVSTNDGNVQLPNDENVQFQTAQTSASKNSRNWTMKQIPVIFSSSNLSSSSTFPPASLSFSLRSHLVVKIFFIFFLSSLFSIFRT